MPNPLIEKLDHDTVEKIMDSEPIKLLLDLHATAIITGRAKEYGGKLLGEVILEASHSRDSSLIQAIEEKIEEADTYRFTEQGGETYISKSRIINILTSFKQ